MLGFQKTKFLKVTKLGENRVFKAKTVMMYLAISKTSEDDAVCCIKMSGNILGIKIYLVVFLFLAMRYRFIIFKFHIVMFLKEV